MGLDTVHTISGKTYSQYDQDIRVIDFFRGLDKDYFVDIGAFDGIYFSNTYKLEKELNWSGICVEPLDEKFALLQSRRNSVWVKSVLSNTSGNQVKFSLNISCR